MAETIQVNEETLKSTDVASVYETKIRVHKTIKVDGEDQGTTSEDEIIEVQQFATTPAMAVVSVPVKVTRNFQSVGVDIGVWLPCYKEELPAAIEEAYRMAKQRVNEEMPTIIATLEEIAG